MKYRILIFSELIFSIGVFHPNLFQFIIGIKDKQEVNEHRLAHLSVGNPPKEGLLIYKNINRNLRKFCEQAIEGKITWLEFLNMVAHQLHVN